MNAGGAGGTAGNGGAGGGFEAEVAAGASSRTAELAANDPLDWAVIRISTASRGELGFPSLETPSMADLAVEVAQV